MRRMLLDIVFWILLGCPALLNASYVQIDFNQNQYFGPDGPWQAVDLRIRYPNGPWQAVNAYPSFLWGYAGLYVPSEEACNVNSSTTCAAGGGITAPPSDSSLEFTEYGFPRDRANYSYDFVGNFTNMDVDVGEDYAVIPDAKVGVMDEALYEYPNGARVPMNAGFAGLGGGGYPSNYYNGTSLPNYLEEVGNAPSDSFGLHIGIAQAAYPGSLTFGGYDEGRVIGKVISYLASSVIQLKDITIGVETGRSPLYIGNKSGLLSPAQSTSEDHATYISPNIPYIFLPNETIQAIIQDLPVFLDKISGYYLWNTTDPQYAKIVASPAYLGFIFADTNGSMDNVTIKVPFALLNLTLDKPVSGRSSRVPYFPLLPSPTTNTRYWSWGKENFHIWLGRAFLQAAFIGGNWGHNKIFLAQAPGPNGISGLDGAIKSINMDQQTLDTGPDVFAESWKGHWTPIEADLSEGSIAGIVVGVTAIITLSASMVFLFWRRKRKQQASPEPATSYSVHPPKSNELEGRSDRAELEQHRGELRGTYSRREMPSQYHASELPGSQPQLQELPANARR